MVRSAATPRVSNHEAVGCAVMVRPEDVDGRDKPGHAGGRDESAPLNQSALTSYAARNIRTALLTTSVMRSREGGGAAWNTKGRNSDAWHSSMNCEAACGRSSIASSFALTRASR